MPRIMDLEGVCDIRKEKIEIIPSILWCERSAIQIVLIQRTPWLKITREGCAICAYICPLLGHVRVVNLRDRPGIGQTPGEVVVVSLLKAASAP